MKMPPKKGGDEKVDIVLIGLEQEENIGLRSIASYLESQGVKVDIEPFGRLPKTKLLEKILDLNPKIVGFSILFQGMLPTTQEIVKYLRANGVKAHFTTGGHFPTIEPQQTFDLMPEIDTIVRHEGEITLLDLYNHIDSPELWHGIKGIVYRTNGTIEFTPPRTLIQDLNAMPFPKRNERFGNFRGLGVCSLLASRGCLFNCSYCSIREFYSGALGPRRRTRSPSNVAQEMETLFTQGVRFFKFVDDDLGMKNKTQQDWMRQFAHELKNRGIATNILWRIAVRVDELDLDILRILQDVGLRFVFLGIEAGCEQSLKMFNKGYHVEEIHRGVEALDQAGVKLEYGFMMFEPESSFSSIRENLSFLGKLCSKGRATLHFTKVYPFVGTAIAKKLECEGRLINDLKYPSYNYRDKRLEMFEKFVFKTFQNAFFGASGLSSRLSMLRFDFEVMKKFHSSEFDVDEYDKRITSLIQEYNSSSFKTLNLALDYLEKGDSEEVKEGVDFLTKLNGEGLEEQSRIGATLTSFFAHKTL